MARETSSSKMRPRETSSTESTWIHRHPATRARAISSTEILGRGTPNAESTVEHRAMRFEATCFETIRRARFVGRCLCSMPEETFSDQRVEIETILKQSTPHALASDLSEW